MKKQYLFLAGMAVAAMSANAQYLKPGYVEWPGSSQLPDYVNRWVPGTPLFEDENFFISRVKPKTYFRNAATQVYPEINEQNDKKLLFWVPVGYDSWRGVRTNGLPNGYFDSEVFSTWSYVTHYGNWTSPYGWVPGGFADAAHKHGTAVSGLASIPFGSITTDWNNCLKSMGSIDAQKLAKFLYFHGVDGLGYNSEFSTSASVVSNLSSMHGRLVAEMRKVNPIFENIWYSGTDDSGSYTWQDNLRSALKGVFGTSESERTSIFLNYNWNSTGYIQTSESNAKNWGRDLRDVYAGMNMQGGCKNDTEWQNHPTHNYSIGLWGAHAYNYLWLGRNTNGSAPDRLQETYQTRLEQWFGNGVRNPIAKVTIPRTTKLSPSDDWFGMSRLMSARSTLSWNLSDEPFISYLNLGNGKFFNYKGERMSDAEWYDISIQDYMPTWRFWLADKFLGKEPENMVENGLDVRFSWDEAYMGGSSLRVKGTVTDEYLHLFKTSFQLDKNDIITVRYKHNDGSANINLALSLEGGESTTVRESSLKVLDASAEAGEGGWQTKEFKLSGANASALNKKPLAMIALHFNEAKNLDIFIGEISIRRGTVATPQAPEIKSTKLLSYNYKGADGKIIFNMANNKPAGDPVYNLDVNVSEFRVWSQQEGFEPVNLSATSSWAAIAYAAPIDGTVGGRVRFGVSAVAADFESESEISWGEWQTLTDYVVDDNVVLSQSVIKPGEEFTISYVDPLHAPSAWALRNAAGVDKATAENTIVFNTSLTEEGAYDLVIDAGTAKERVLSSFVQITGWDKGALPRILSLGVNDEIDNANGVDIKVNDEIKLSYTGREADGITSRGVQLNEKLFGVNCGELGLASYHSFSVAAWIHFDENADGTYSFMTIENRQGNWPKNNWGKFWCRVNSEGYLINSHHDGGYGGSLDSGADGMRLYVDYAHNARIIPGAWTHVCFVFEYNDSKQIRYKFYINGVPQTMSTWAHMNKATREGKITPDDWSDYSDASLVGAQAVGHNVTETGFVSDGYPVVPGDWISFGGTTQDINAMNATIDNLVVWNKAVTDDEVAASMTGLDASNLPEDVLGFWSLDIDPDPATHYFANQTGGAGRACRYEHHEADGEGAARNQPIASDYVSGSPFVAGKVYKVTTTPSWDAKGAVFSQQSGNATEGSAIATVAKERDITARLTLSNSLGSDSRDYPVISVKNLDVLGQVEAENLEVYAVDHTIFLSFAEEGNYTINVYNVAGALMNSRSVKAAAGEVAAVSMITPDTYIVAVARDGKTVRNVKVVVR